MKCPACQQRDAIPTRSIMSWNVCQECFDEFKNLKEFDPQAARDWCAKKLRRKNCGEKAKGWIKGS